MKHFPQFMQLLRSAWDGDKSGSVERAQQLAAQLEQEGDSAHARMLRFTMQSLQAKDAPESVPAPGASPAAATAVEGAAAVARGSGGDGQPSIELTFGRWDDADATVW